MLRRLAAGLHSVLNLVVPSFQPVEALRRPTWIDRVVLHILLLVAGAVVLYFADHYWLRLGPLLKITERLGFLKDYWLSCLFVLFYLFGLLSVWLVYLILPPDQVTDEFPDIDRAWESARAALANVRVPLQDLPLFLILGTPEEDERALFHGSRLQVGSGEVDPDDLADPVRVYATKDGIFVTCAGASALGCYARSLVYKEADPTDHEDADQSVEETMRPGSTNTAAPRRAFARMVEVLIQAQREKRQLTKAEKRELRCFYRQDNPRRSILCRPELLDLQVARLEHLCRLIVRDRAPFCPVNGILLLIPFAGLDSDSDGSDTGNVCQRDLTAAITTLRVHCPLIALVCDVETAPGFSDFVRQFTSEERLKRLGQRCHMIPGFSPSAGADEPAQAHMGRGLADWLCNPTVKSWIDEKFQLEEQKENLCSVVVCNSRLFLFFDELQQRGKRLGNILANVLLTERDPRRLLFGGCYLGATGADRAQEQAWVKGVLDKLIKLENCVYWTDAALWEEAGYRRWFVFGQCLLIVFVFVLAVLLWSWRS